MERYTRYKDSGIEWVGEIPEHWKTVRLRFIGSTKAGLGNKKPEDFGNGEPFLTYKDVYSSYTVGTPSGLVRSTSEERERFSVKCGDAFFTGSSETIEELGLSSVCVEDIPNCTFNGFTIRLRPYSLDNYYPRYMAYAFRSELFRGYLTQTDNSVTRANLSQQLLKNVIATIPPIEEQSAIASFLDKKTSEINALISDTEKSIELLGEYKKSVISEAVTKGLDPNVQMKDSGVEWIGEIPEHWKTRSMKWIFELQKRQPQDEDQIITCFRDGTVTLRTNRRTEGFTMSDKEIGYQHICVNDLVIHGMDGFAGAIGVSDSEGKASPVLIPLTARSGESPKYYMYLLRVFALRQVFVALAKGIRERSTDLRWSMLGLLKFTYPPLEEQHEVAEHLDALIKNTDDLISEKRLFIGKLNEYKKSLISEAVTGKFKVPIAGGAVEH